LFGGLAGRQKKATAISRVSGQLQVVVGLVDARGIGKSAAVRILALHLGHGGGHGTPTVVQESRVGGARQKVVAINHQGQLGIQVFPDGGIAVRVGVPTGEKIRTAPEIVGGGADRRRSVGARGINGIRELPHGLLVDVGP